jgi:hypothetical protein
MTQIFTIIDDAVVINKLALTYTSGTVRHTGSLEISGDATVANLSADTITVKKLITGNGALGSIGQWNYNTEDELNGKGFSWSTDTTTTNLVYRTGNRLWTNANLDLGNTSAYSIDNEVVLSANSLGNSVVNSNLRKLGTLQSLEVSGDAQISDFAFFNSTYNRFGIGTDEPNAAISILENNVEIAIGSPDVNIATIGTFSNHDLGIISDNAIRILVKASGEVVVGDAVSKTGVLRVYGTIYAESIQTDNRIDRTHSLEFRGTANSDIYGLGLKWLKTGVVKSLVLASDSDRFVSSENFDLADGKSYNINNTTVLTKTQLGDTVVSSNLTSVGTLGTLTVDGNATFNSDINVNNVRANSVSLNNLVVTGAGFESETSAQISVNSVKAFYADTTEVNVGDTTRQDIPVKVFGPLSVGINNPDPSLKFSVAGDVSIGGKKFTSGETAPTSGAFQVGDICWNTRPQATSHVGWICIVTGEPGEWLPFGLIGS